MVKSALVAAVAAAVVGVGGLSIAGEVGFEKKTLSRDFYAEGAGVGDFNKDGKADVVSGPFWWEGPAFETKHSFYEAKKVDPHGYSENFFSWGMDVNKDGWDDVLVVGFPGKEAWWYENPKGKEGAWERHLVANVVDNESPGVHELVKGGKQLVFHSGGRFGYAVPVEGKPDEPWAWHPISRKGDWQRFTHGLGVGDVNGDGRNDVIFKDGWWEQPESLEGDPEWKEHKFRFAQDGAQMYVYDVNGDGKNDVITSWHCHGYGLLWWEQKGEDQWERHDIMGKMPADNAQGVVFTQPHGVALADVDGDGLMDIVTGKRWWAHGPTGDPESGKAAVLYWFGLKREGTKAEYVAHQIDDDSGVGTEVKAVDVSGDGKIDVVVGNKKGVFVHVQKAAATASAAGK